MLALLSIAFAGCNVALIEPVADPIGDPRFAHFPLVEHETTLPWTEQYPAITPDWDVIARLPDDDVTGYQLSDSARFRIDKAYRILRWQDIREQGDYDLEVTDADDTVVHRFTLESRPSPFLEQLFAELAGAGATLQRWYVHREDAAGYLYVEGAKADESQAAWEVLFALKRDTANEAELLARTIAPIDSPDELPIFTDTSVTFPITVSSNAIIARQQGELEQRCIPPAGQKHYAYTHDYVTTREQLDTHPAFGDRMMLIASSGSQEFLLLPTADQRNCFVQAYLFEILPDIKPTTTAAHRDSLPGAMHYTKDKYSLVWAEEFNGTVAGLLREGYNIGYTGFDRRPSHNTFLTNYAPQSTPQTHDDPVKIANGKLFMGYGLSSLEYNADGTPTYNCDPEQVGHEAFNPTKCAHATWADPFAPPYYFKYGYLEIDYARTPATGNYGYISFLGPQGYGLSRPRSIFSNYQDRHAPNRPLRRVFNTRNRDTSFEWEARFHGWEFQLMEFFYRDNDHRENIILDHYWVTNFYGLSYPTSGFANFHYTISEIERLKYTFGIEWTPEGYSIWTKKGNNFWSKLSTKRYNSRGIAGPSHQCHEQTGGNPSTVNGTIGVIQCGILHLPARPFVAGMGKYSDNAHRMRLHYNRLKAENDQAGLNRLSRDRFMEINHIRVYKPENNYETIAPLYQ